MTPETIIIIVFCVVILIELLMVYNLYSMIRRLRGMFDQMGGKMDLADNEREEVVKNIEELKQ